MNQLLALFFALMSFSAFADVGRPLEGLPIQDAGRVKPFGTFAEESLQLIYGKKTYEKKSASEIVFTWLLIPDHWVTQPIIEIRHHGVKEALKLDSPDKYFTAQSLFTNPRITLIFQELQNHRARQEKLNPYFQAVSRLENQLGLFQAIRMGTALRFVPDPASDTWKAVPQLDGEMRDAFQKVGKGFVDSISNTASGEKPRPSEEFKTAVEEFIAKARALAPDKYVDATKINLELHLNHFHPFKWAWIAYLFAFFCMVAAYAYGSRPANIGGWLFVLIGFALHTYGMALRSYLSGRPPVSNMYETVIWVPWGVLFFAMILERVQKNKLLLACASAVAVFCLILTDMAPTILDKSLHPLEPVLRSTFWLSTHVLIITISYAAFFLAFALGDLVLFYYLKDEKKYAKQIQMASLSIYRLIQIGVVLLAFGIILGGIWADYSWGRFWGWDPKETWALIALLGYLALLHGKLIGLVRNFGMAVGAVVSFLLVIMAWYGVNMVLGAGLHTYGFGAGGIVEVMTFCVLHLLFVAYVSAARYPVSKNLSK